MARFPLLHCFYTTKLQNHVCLGTFLASQDTYLAWLFGKRWVIEEHKGYKEEEGVDLIWSSQETNNMVRTILSEALKD